MSIKQKSLLNIYGFSVITSLAILLLVGLHASFGDFIKVLILAVLEISFSFDNAVVNAKILAKMSPLWQRLFMTIGILIAVIGVRVLLPLVIVGVASGLGLREVGDLALHHPTEYAEQLHRSHPVIAAFGGMFLLLLFLDFILVQREISWLVPIEKRMIQLGEIKRIGIFIAVVILLIVVTGLVPANERWNVLIAGFVGILCYLGISTLDKVFEHTDIHENKKKGAAAVMKAGLIGFLYLEIIDASFSLDGVIGAFAITDKVLLIAGGLGIGALFVRSLTVHMLHRGVLAKYRYMEHGAHYAIGILAILMLAGIRYDVPEVVTGLSGVVCIGAAILHSRLEAKVTH